MIDLWGDAGTQPGVKERPFSEPKVDLDGKDLVISVKNSVIKIDSQSPLTNRPGFSSLRKVDDYSTSEQATYELPLNPVNAFILRHLLRGINLKITPPEAKLLSCEADKVPKPIVKLSETGKHIEIQVPPIEEYKAIVRVLNGFPLKNGVHRVPLGRTLDFIKLVEDTPKGLPPFIFDSRVKALNEEPIENFDGTMDSLRQLPIGSLNIVRANTQTWKSVSKSNKTLEEKIEAFGIKTLHDLVFHLPRRYIDKTTPQEIQTLMVDEQATIIGIVESVSDIPNNMGVRFTIKTENGSSIPAVFWRQHWLKRKFPVGSHVLITGKVSFWQGRRNLNGSSIEDAREAALLPIVPIYKQSESKGITTTLITTAVRELFSRLGPIDLPKYLQGENRIDYYTAFKELHLPSSLETHADTINALAYYELVYMQILIQEAKESSASRTGIKCLPGERNLQRKAIQAIPFTLTGSQEKAVNYLNDKMGETKPSSVLLNADVGAGKSLVAQLACLRAVEAGYQAVLLGPTEVLARQLYATFQKVNESLNTLGESVNIVFLSGSLKAVEKRAVMKTIASGEADIIVGTHSVLSSSVDYKNLGFIAIDEQQKFGAEQRTALLNSRSDGLVPDLLMQTATPIPRSTAQVFYGDIDMITLDEKPPGRLEIITKWIQEDPNDVVTQIVNPMWADILEEASKGNQIFVITPMVKDSNKVDAASVERTYKTLTDTFPTLRVGYVHGQMKQDQQNQTMEEFRNKAYDVLVASTVIEVGVDIPDATRVIILSADRLGASSLHQIRGRVGRNDKQAICYLVSLGVTESSQARLNSLVESTNGFDVAKADLGTRGHGKIFSNEQSGASDMVFATLYRHGRLVSKARDEAIQILNSEHREQALSDSHAHFQSQERLV
jgi:ATP-dependent DNA helicase RecG